MAHEMRNGTTKERKKERKKRTFRFLMKKTNEKRVELLTGRSNRNHRSKIKEIVDKLAIWWLLAIPTRHSLSFKKKCSSFVHFHSPQNNVENVFDHQGYDHQHFPITNKSGQFEKKLASCSRLPCFFPIKNSTGQKKIKNKRKDCSIIRLSIHTTASPSRESR